MVIIKDIDIRINNLLILVFIDTVIRPHCTEYVKLCWLYDNGYRLVTVSGQ